MPDQKRTVCIQSFLLGYWKEMKLGLEHLSRSYEISVALPVQLLWLDLVPLPLLSATQVETSELEKHALLL